MARRLIMALLLCALAASPAAAQGELGPAARARGRRGAGARQRRPGDHDLHRGARGQVAAERPPRDHPQRSRASPTRAASSRRKRSRTSTARSSSIRSMPPSTTIAATCCWALGAVQRGGQGFRPRDAAGARLCRRLQQPRRRLHEARPDRPGDRRLHQGHQADADQRRGAERARPRASRGRIARTAPSAISRAPSALDARFGAAYRSRAEAKMAIERYEEAIEDFSRAIAFEPRNAEIYALRGHGLHGGRQRRLRHQGLRQGHRACARLSRPSTPRAGSPMPRPRPTRRRSTISPAPSSSSRARPRPTPTAPGPIGSSSRPSSASRTSSGR